jgi:ABC-type antimicrobial peptide transport system permease subunit
VLITSFPNLYGQVGIKVEAGSNLPETITEIEKAWKKVYPDGVFEFKFLDAQIDAFYKTETRLYQMFKIFAGLAMLISCLGLWGLSTLSAQQRTKEIGIRKVLGASVNAIVMMLSKDFFYDGPDCFGSRSTTRVLPCK